MLRAEPEKLFVFGDNLLERGFGGQAKEMRGEPNAVGLPTKRSPSMCESAFFASHPRDYLKVQIHARAAQNRLWEHVVNGGVVVWPNSGIGTGLAQLETRAPRIFAFYSRFLELLQDVAA